MKWNWGRVRRLLTTAALVFVWRHACADNVRIAVEIDCLQGEPALEVSVRLLTAEQFGLLERATRESRRPGVTVVDADTLKRVSEHRDRTYQVHRLKRIVTCTSNGRLYRIVLRPAFGQGYQPAGKCGGLTGADITLLRRQRVLSNMHINGCGDSDGTLMTKLIVHRDGSVSSESTDAFDFYYN